MTVSFRFEFCLDFLKESLPWTLNDNTYWHEIKKRVRPRVCSGTLKYRCVLPFPWGPNLKHPRHWHHNPSSNKVILCAALRYLMTSERQLLYYQHIHRELIHVFLLASDGICHGHCHYRCLHYSHHCAHSSKSNDSAWAPLTSCFNSNVPSCLVYRLTPRSGPSVFIHDLWRHSHSTPTARGNEWMLKLIKSHSSLYCFQGRGAFILPLCLCESVMMVKERCAKRFAKINVFSRCMRKREKNVNQGPNFVRRSYDPLAEKGRFRHPEISKSGEPSLQRKCRLRSSSWRRH